MSINDDRVTFSQGSKEEGVTASFREVPGYADETVAPVINAETDPRPPAAVHDTGLSFSEIIAKMAEVAPPGQWQLDGQARAVLVGLTRSLMAARKGGAEEHARFLAVGERDLCLPEAELAGRLGSAIVLVTGGTGCVGSALMAQVAARRPGRLVSVSRGLTSSWPTQAEAEYRYADIRDRGALERLIREVRPDLVFHVAAQRDPGLAEMQVNRTVSTNVLGTRNVLAAAAEAGVSQVVCASTGKALRPYSPEVYTASKRAAEWVAWMAANTSGMLVSAGRFTHVMENSIIYQRLLEWASNADGVIRLHGTEIAFYVQSALESAQLLLLACLGARRGEFRIHAISDLGWPISLLDLTLAVLARSGSSTPVYFSGYDRGYEEIPFPGLYDPRTAGEVSPLLNAFEAGAIVDSCCPMTDSFRLELAPDPRAMIILTALAEVCGRTQDADLARGTLNELSWLLLDATLCTAPREALMHAATMTQRCAHFVGADHRRVLKTVRDHANASRSNIT
jgi:nucleoside-diphosphate-sugar epimerase